MYALAELSLLAPPAAPSSSEDRIEAAVVYSRQLLRSTGRVGEEMDNAAMFAHWVTNSWRGIGRSLAP